MFKKLGKFLRWVFKWCLIFVVISLLAVIASELANNPVCLTEVRQVAEAVLGAVSACVAGIKSVFNSLINAIAGLAS